MRRIWLVVLVEAFVFVVVFVASSRAARADEVAEARGLLTRQAEAIAKGDKEAFAATLTADAFVILPGHDHASLGRARAGDLMYVKWVNQPSPPTRVVVDNVLAGSAGAQTAWISADFESHHPWEGATKAVIKIKARVTALVIKDGDAWRVAAEHVSVGLPNAKAHETFRKKAFPTLADIPGPTSLGPMTEWLQSGAALAARTSDHAAAIVLGSDAGERAVGGKAKGLMQAFNHAKFRVVGGLREVEISPTARYLAANLELTMKMKGEMVTIPYRVLLVARLEGTGGWRLVSAHFSNGQ